MGLGRRRTRRRVTGQEVIKQNFARLRRGTFRALEVAMIEQAEALLTEANNKAPQLTSDMINGAVVTSVRNRSKGRIRVAMAYTHDYAIWQHEEIFNPGPITSVKLGPARGVGRKWLQKVFDKLLSLKNEYQKL